MGAGPSMERLLYDSVRAGEDPRVRYLHGEGARINWMRSSGKTPLIVACSSANRLHVAKTLIELGADVNYYQPGGTVGTAIRNAAQGGLEETVILLLSYGANPLLGGDNSNGGNSLDLARRGCYTGVVRAIEDKISFFSGWLRYFSGTNSQNSTATRIWAVVLPGDSALSTTIPEQLKFALYHDRQSPRPLKVVSLKKFHVHQPNFLLPDPELVLSPKSFGKEVAFLSGIEGDKEQLKLLYDVCRGRTETIDPLLGSMTRATPPRWPPSSPMTASLPVNLQEKHEIAMATAASIKSAVEEGVPLSDVSFNSLELLTGFNTISPTGTPNNLAMATVQRSSGLNASCVICNDAPIEVVLIPCGHLVGCKTCLTEVKMKNFGCPVCRARIKQIMKIYTV